MITTILEIKHFDRFKPGSCRKGLTPAQRHEARATTYHLRISTQGEVICNPSIEGFCYTMPGNQNSNFDFGKHIMEVFQQATKLVMKKNTDCCTGQQLKSFNQVDEALKP